MARPRFKVRPTSRRPLDFNESWLERHRPQKRGELAVHEKKLQEIAAALSPSSTARVLLLSGPAGSGKSTALKVLAEELGLGIVEFHAAESSVGTTSVMDSFRDFLAGASVFDRHRSLILVEELPNVFHEGTRAEFESALMDWADEPDQPIVAVSFTEIEINAKYSEALVVSRILGELVQSEFCVHIKVNPPNVTLVKRALSQVCKAESADVEPAVLKELAECGDVRNALIALEMYCRASGNSGPLWVRDSPTELFHAIGKVVWTSKKQNSLEEAIERFEESMDFFNLTILDNYASAKHQRLPTGAAADVAEWLSLADVMPNLAKLSALGAAHEIEVADEDLAVPKRFIALRLTQFMHWRRQKFESESRIRINMKNRRMLSNQVTTPFSLVYDELAYESKIKKPVNILDIIDDDDDDDFDLDNFA